MEIWERGGGRTEDDAHATIDLTCPAHAAMCSAVRLCLSMPCTSSPAATLAPSASRSPPRAAACRSTNAGASSAIAHTEGSLRAAVLFLLADENKRRNV